MKEKQVTKVRPFLRCLNIPDSEYELLRELSLNDNRSLSSFIRKLIKKEWQKQGRRKELAPTG